MPRNGCPKDTLGGLCTTMVMFRRGRRRPRMRMNPIQSVKNQLATKQSLLGNTLEQIFIAQSVDVGAATKITGREVPTGASIYSIDVSVNFISSTGGQTGTFDWVLMKTREGQGVVSLITSPDWSDIGLANGRNQVIKSFMTIFATEDGGSVKYNLHIKIPKIYQRMRAGDNFVIALESSDAGTLAVGARYKYYT